MTITAATTLAELALLCGKHGVTELNVGISPGSARAYRVSLVYSSQIVHSLHRGVTTKTLKCVGDGKLLHEALDDAFARFIHRANHETL